MNIYHEPSFSIFFGDEQTKFIPTLFHGLPASNLKTIEPFSSLQNAMDNSHTVFLTQIHGAQGVAFNNYNNNEYLDHVRIFEDQGDFLTTNISGLALGIVTADCLPIILYDMRHHALCIIHAGWRSSVAGIIKNALTMMHIQYLSQPHDLKVFFGPSAQACCYVVSNDFIKNLQHFQWKSDVLYKKNNGLFFDLPRFNQIQLLHSGLKKKNFHFSHQCCTICNKSFCSVRRQKTEYRQMTIVALQNK